MDTYKQRCNDPEEKRRWLASGLVRLDTLSVGDVFECIDGTCWQVRSRTRLKDIHAMPYGGIDHEVPSDFVGSAMVRPVSLWTGLGLKQVSEDLAHFDDALGGMR